MQLPLINTIRPPTRIVPSGTIAINAGSFQDFLGSNGRQDRLQIIITNLDPALLIKIQNLSNLSFLTVFPQRSVTIETNADLRIANPNGAPVSVEVGELYPSWSYNSPVASPQPYSAAVAPGGAPGAPTGGGGAPTGGGGGFIGGGGGGRGTHQN